MAGDLPRLAERANAWHGDLYTISRMPHESVPSFYRRIGAARQQRLIRVAGRLLGRAELAVRIYRIGVCRIALLEWTRFRKRVRSILSVQPTRNVRDWQFTLLCHADLLSRSASRRERLPEAARVAGRFLLRTGSDAGRVAWMGAHVLGEHFPLYLALPELARAARSGRSASARYWSAQALGVIRGRTKSARTHRRITVTLRKIAKTDRSIAVREIASKLAPAQ